MALTLWQKTRGVWDVITGRYDRRTETELGRFQGRVFAELADHGLFRRRWTNAGMIAQDVYRANHPNAAQLARWKARGIVEVLSLRPGLGVVHGYEAATCAELGLTLRNVALAARSAPQPLALLDLLNVFETLQKPALIHCKSGADRTGLAGALWAIHMEGAPVATARRHLALRHLHVKWSKTGVLDRVLDQFEAEGEAKGIALRDWIANHYDPTRL